jgi:predicted RNase H-like HicB family nuclease
MANVTSDNYLIVIEKTAKNLSAFSPDLPGCAATGADRAEVETRMAEAIRTHLDGLREDGLPIPEPSSEVAYVPVIPREAEQ